MKVILDTNILLTLEKYNLNQLKVNLNLEPYTTEINIREYTKITNKNT